MSGWVAIEGSLRSLPVYLTVPSGAGSVAIPSVGVVRPAAPAPHDRRPDPLKVRARMPERHRTGSAEFSESAMGSPPPEAQTLDPVARIQRDGLWLVSQN